MNFGPPSQIASKRDRMLQQSLFEAAQKGDALLLEALTIEGADLNAKDVEGMAAIHHAAAHGQVNIIKLLIEKGIDINDISSTGRTALHYAIERAYCIHRDISSTICFLIEHNANVMIKFETASAILNYNYHKILQSNLREFWTLKLHTNKQELYPGELEMMFLALSINPIKAYEAAIQKMVRFKVNLYVQNREGNTAMYYAARCGNVKLIKQFLKAGVPINQVINQKNQTMLHAAIIGSNDLNANNVDAIQLLIKFGADVQFQDMREKTPEAYLPYLDPVIEQQVSNAIQKGLVQRDGEKDFQVGKALVLIEAQLNAESSSFPQEVFKNCPIPTIAMAYDCFMKIESQKVKTIEKPPELAYEQEIKSEPQQKNVSWCTVQ